MSTCRPLVVVLLALSATLHATPARARQDIVLPGRVIDAESKPVPGVGVMLHRVTAAGGTLLSEVVTDSAGMFELRAAGPPEADAIYFAGARYGQELFIGPMLRSPLPADGEYVLQVGVPGTSAMQALGGTTPPTTAPAIPVQQSPPESNRLWVLALFPLAALIALGGFFIDRRVPSERRRLLIELATFEESSPPDDTDPHARDARARLRRRIRVSAIE